MNLFLSTRRLTEAKEDHLTEFLASALDVDEGFRRAYASTVLQTYGSQQGWEPAEIKAITTQVDYLNARCRPDLALTLADGHIIVCEHKLDAPETLGELVPAEEECAPVGQLERYLELPGVDAVAYFRSSWKTPDKVVLGHRRYIRPSSGREHFLWSDLYGSLSSGSTLVCHWLRDAFETFGFTPPHPSIGEFDGLANRENLKKLWDLTRTRLRNMGWNVENGSICQLYLRNNADSNADTIYVSPFGPGGRILLVRVTPRNAEKIAEMSARLRSSTMAALEVESVYVPRAGGSRAVIDVKIPFTRLLEGASGVQEIEHKLSDHVCCIADRVSTGGNQK
jgi:hypothetical protein